jgi:hypothetical protein
MCNCQNHVHGFVCYLRNIATDANVPAMSNGNAKNAR